MYPAEVGSVKQGDAWGASGGEPCPKRRERGGGGWRAVPKEEGERGGGGGWGGAGRCGAWRKMQPAVGGEAMGKSKARSGMLHGTFFKGNAEAKAM